MAAPPDAAPGRSVRLELILTRDGPRCVWCGRILGGLVPPTTEHLIPKIKGGPSWIENELAACRRCNQTRGHQGVVAWMLECERRGWDVDRARVTAGLERLAAAIATRGGQRRARTTLRHAQRRLRTMG